MVDGSSCAASRSERGAGNVASSAARAHLAAAIAELAAAEAELAAVQEPATQLTAIIASASRLDADLAALRAADQHQLGSWLAAGGNDPRPARDPAIIGAEQSHAALAADAAAARAALPAAEAAFQDRARKVIDAQRRRDAAMCAVAAEAAREFGRGYRSALIAALRLEAVLHGLRGELLHCGNAANPLPGALEAAAIIGEVIGETKRGASVRHDAGAARRLLADLIADPDAQLQMDSAT